MANLKLILLRVDWSSPDTTLLIVWSRAALPSPKSMNEYR